MIPNHIKVFEEFENRSGFMKMEFSNINQNRYNIDIENFPDIIKKTDPNLSPEEQAEFKEMGFDDDIQIEDHYIDTTIIKYKITAYTDSVGISDIDFEMESVNLIGTYTVWNKEIDEASEFDFEIEDNGPFNRRVEFKTNSLPFYPESLTIIMNNSFDPSKFTYQVEIGQ